MRLLLLASVACIAGGSAFGQSLLGQSQPGGGQARPVVVVPESPPVVAAPPAPLVAAQPVAQASVPPQGLVATPLPPPNMIQQPSAPQDNGGQGSPQPVAQSAAQPVPQPVIQPAAQPVQMQAVSPSIQAPANGVAGPSAPAATTASVAASAGSSGSAVSVSASSPVLPNAASPAALPTNDVPPVQNNQWVNGHVATLGVLNKVDGSTKTLTIPVGGQAVSGDLTVSVQACAMHQPGSLPDSAVFLTLQSTQNTNSGAPVYRGWIVKSEPGSSNAENADEAFRVVGCS